MRKNTKFISRCALRGACLLTRIETNFVCKIRLFFNNKYPFEWRSVCVFVVFILFNILFPWSLIRSLLQLVLIVPVCFILRCFNIKFNIFCFISFYSIFLSLSRSLSFFMNNQRYTENHRWIISKSHASVKFFHFFTLHKHKSGVCVYCEKG